MPKTVIHHLSRGMILTLQCAAVGFACFLVAWVILLWRLTQGPLEVSFLTEKLGEVLTRQQGHFVFNVGSTELAWRGRTEPLELQMKQVLVSRADKTPVLSIARIGMQLSKRRLLFGQFVPRSLEIEGPALRVIHWQDGHFTLNLGEQPVSADAAEETQPQQDLIQDLLLELQNQKFSFLGGLRDIHITDATVFYDDRALKVKWTSRAADIAFSREKRGILGHATLPLALAPQRNALLRLEAAYDWKARRTDILTAFSDLNLHLVAQQSANLQSFSGIDIPLKGTVALRFDEHFILQQTRFLLMAEAGNLKGMGIYEEPVPVQSAFLSGSLNFKTGEGAIEQWRLNLGTATAEGSVVSTGNVESYLTVRSRSVLKGMPIDELSTWWPKNVAPHARAWVIKHLSKGQAQRATLDLDMKVEKRGNDFASSLLKLGGEIDFSGIRVDYFPPLLPVLDVAGHAFYDRKSFNLDLKGGVLQDMQLRDSAIRITDLDIADDTRHAQIDIQTALKGPLKTALTVLDAPPLQYPKTMGIAVADVAGDADINVHFIFPLHEKLALNEVKVETAAKLENVFLSHVLGPLPLKGGALKLTVKENVLSVSGPALFGDMPAQFEWRRDFSAAANIQQQVEGHIELQPAGLIALGLPNALLLEGVAPSNVSYQLKSNGVGHLALQSDLSSMAFSVPYANFKKDKATEGKVQAQLEFKKGQLTRIGGLDLRIAGHDTLKGQANFSQKGIEMASFPEIFLGNNKLSATLKRAADGYRLDLSGQQIDATEILRDLQKKEGDASAPSAPLFVAVTAGRIITGYPRSIESAQLTMQRDNWHRIEMMKMAGQAGSGPFSIQYLPEKAGQRLTLTAADAGSMLSALGITQSIRKGNLSIHAGPYPTGQARDLAGKAILSDFTLVDAPILARLLNALSVPGLLNLMNNRGIGFRKAKAEFFWTERGPPTDATAVQVLQLKNGETAGASLGLTFEGYIDQKAGVCDLKGTIIPVSDINKLFATIPLVGNLLTGGSSVFAATYSVKGLKADPTVNVNPISVLAPGILRKLFFEH